jgi:hypothetical protein
MSKSPLHKMSVDVPIPDATNTEAHNRETYPERETPKLSLTRGAVIEGPDCADRAKIDENRSHMVSADPTDPPHAKDIARIGDNQRLADAVNKKALTSLFSFTLLERPCPSVTIAFESNNLNDRPFHTELRNPESDSPETYPEQEKSSLPRGSVTERAKTDETRCKESLMSSLASITIESTVQLQIWLASGARENPAPKTPVHSNRLVAGSRNTRKATNEKFVSAVN